MVPTPDSPYIIVAQQETARMNKLLSEIVRSLDELQKGMAGALNMTVPMGESTVP